MTELEAARTDLAAKNGTMVGEIDQVQQQHAALNIQTAELREAIARENADSAACAEPSTA